MAAYDQMKADPVGFLRAVVEAETAYADFPPYTGDAISLVLDRLPEGWRCFHCGEVLTTQDAAAEHFGDGNYEGDVPVCIEAATAEMKSLVLTNREMFRELCKERETCEQVEFERDCWAGAARKFLEQPNATWHDLASFRETADGRVIAAEAAINAAPKWLAGLLRWNAERLWKRRQAGRSPMKEIVA